MQAALYTAPSKQWRGPDPEPFVWVAAPPLFLGSPAHPITANFWRDAREPAGARELVQRLPATLGPAGATLSDSFPLERISGKGIGKETAALPFRLLILLLLHRLADLIEILLDCPAILLGRGLVATLLQVVAELRSEAVPVHSNRRLGLLDRRPLGGFLYAPGESRLDTRG